jgi:hypothetical protein
MVEESKNYNPAAGSRAKEISSTHGKQESGKSINNEGVTIKYIETQKSALKFTEKLVKNK